MIGRVRLYGPINTELKHEVAAERKERRTVLAFNLHDFMVHVGADNK